jgi:transposase
MLSDAQWALLEPLIEACRPKGKTQPQDLSDPQTFIRWTRLGVWERLLHLVQERGIQLGMTFLDGTSVRAHQKAAGARQKGLSSSTRRS